MTRVRSVIFNVLRWSAVAIWIAHGGWVLVNQFHGYLLGELLIGISELVAAALLVRQSTVGHIVAAVIATVSGALSMISLTKTPQVVDHASAMASIAVLGTAVTILVVILGAIRNRSQRT